MAKLTAASPTLLRATKTVTFTGAAGLGAIGTGTVFTLTGEVLVVGLVPFCTLNVAVDAGAGIASIQLGVANNTTFFVASTQADAIDTGEFWVDNAPDANAIAVPSGLKDIALTQDIQFEVTSTGTQ